MIRAREKLAAARHLLDGGFGADAVPPAYFAVFQMAEAALAIASGRFPTPNPGSDGRPGAVSGIVALLVVLFGAGRRIGTLETKVDMLRDVYVREVLKSARQGNASTGD